MVVNHHHVKDGERVLTSRVQSVMFRWNDDIFLTKYTYRHAKEPSTRTVKRVNGLIPRHGWWDADNNDSRKSGFGPKWSIHGARAQGQFKEE